MYIYIYIVGNGEIRKYEPSEKSEGNPNFKIQKKDLISNCPHSHSDTFFNPPLCSMLAIQT